MVSRPRLRPGFTMVELLIVIAIIALLMVLLLGALRYAIGSSRTTQCMSNLKQIGAGLHSFANRNKSWGPPGPPNAFNSTIPTNVLWTSEVQLPQISIAPPAPPQRRGSRYLSLGYLWYGKDINDQQAFYCPDIVVDNDAFGTASAPTNYDNTVGVADPQENAALDANLTPGSWWHSSYDYRATNRYFVLGANQTVNIDVTFDVPDGMGGSTRVTRSVPQNLPYTPVNFGKQGAETAVLSDMLQNPGGVKTAHDNTRYNVVFADGHGALFNDDNRAVVNFPAISTATPPIPALNYQGTIAGLQIALPGPSYNRYDLDNSFSPPVQFNYRWYNPSFDYVEHIWRNLLSSP